jgi:hypothetical protein
MPDLSELVDLHGTVRRYRVELVLEHADGFSHKIASAAVNSRAGLTADDMHRELLKTAGQLTVLDIETDAREKQARSRRPV